MSRRARKTRREFLKDAARVAGAASLAGLAGCFPEVGGHWPHVTEQCLDGTQLTPNPGTSRVTEVFCEASVVTEPRYALNAEAMRPMVDAVLGGLAPSIAELWSRAFPDFTQETRIGIKVNCLNVDCATSVPLVKALVDLLKETLRLDAERIIVWDRRLDELTRCKFTEEAVGCRVMGTINSTKDAGGPGYGEPICGAVAGKMPRLSRLLTDLTDVTINVPVLKTHGVSGVTAAFKNIYGIIDNPADYHDNLVTAMPELYRLPPIRKSLRLHLLDAFQAVTVGGTSDPSDCTPKLVAASLDPLAFDAYSLNLVNKLRAARGVGAVDSKVTGWLEGAFKAGLGTLEHELVQMTI
ncbi:MAG: DUF362 domain-containing protein [Deltaproteobacteria bacterium]|nr:DUF362 domain-containing protein [Deltaproteobacteria bacterium]